MSLKKFLKRIESLTAELVLEDVLNDQEVLDLIVTLNKEQLSLGKDSEGELIGTYSEATADIARNYQAYDVPRPVQPKIAGEPYNFQWRGDFFDSIKALEKDFVVIIEGGLVQSLEGGQVDLLEKFGDNILGLNQVNFKKVEDLICGKSISFITNYLFS